MRMAGLWPVHTENCLGATCDGSRALSTYSTTLLNQGKALVALVTAGHTFLPT